MADGNSVALPKAAFAKHYIERHGLALVKLPPGKKYPTHDDWEQPGGYFTDADEAAEFYTQNPNWGMGAVLGPSRLCSLDIDNLEESRIILSEFGIDVDAWADRFPSIVGNPARFRIEFRAPADFELATHRVSWPDQDDPKRSHVVFELRAGLVQDVLPPTLHPETGAPYSWRRKPGATFPELPAELLVIWQQWDVFKANARALCPWAVDVPQPPAAPTRPRQADEPSVIEAYNEAHDIRDALEHHGYKRQGKRYLSPHSKTKLPGVVLLPGNRAWIHHASDPLGGEKPVNPFDLFLANEHGGDLAAATKAAARLLGIAHKTRAEKQAERQAAYKAAEAAGERVDPETGEIIEGDAYAPAQGLGGVITLPERRHVDTASPLFDTTGEGMKPLATIGNLEEILRRIGATVRYNVISKRVEILLPGHKSSVDNRDSSALSEIYSWCAKFRYPVGQVEPFILNIADRNPHNPVATWIMSKDWDGVSRIDELFNTIATPNPRLRDTVMRRWFLSAVAAAFDPHGVSAHGILVLQGPQYLGKTRWLKRLVPADLAVFQDGLILAPSDKDSVMKCVRNWIVELGEVDATFRKSDMAQLKAFITQQTDVVRLPYARAESTFARRTVFAASVNERGFLADPTGNRRFWTVEATFIDHAHEIDMQQVWREFYELYKSGESWFLTGDEMGALNEHNTDFEVVDPIRDRITTRFDWTADKARWRWLTATDALIECGFDRPTKADATRAGAVIVELNGGQRRRTNAMRQVLVPPRPSASPSDW